ncbi:hypothetical protein JVU11DRAFT_10103 [Chiua virens]|nr:hypothetical protein JVU11DRAFT_10103 [Chiua virens]
MGPQQPEASCWENTYVVNIQRLREDKRNGGYIFEDIIKPLTRQWAYPPVQEVVRGCLVEFHEGIIPKMIQWTTYPITAMLEIIWEKYEPKLDDRPEIDPQVIKMTSILERCLNYAHTGSAKVLPRGVMDVSWLSLGIIFDGMPTLSKDFASHAALVAGNLQVIPHAWPVYQATMRPMTSSNRVQVYNYGDSHFETYYASFTIKHGMKHFPDTLYPEVTDLTKRMACFAAEIALKVYIEDVKVLISQHVTASVQTELTSDHPQARRVAQRRSDALAQWKESQHPLAMIPHVVQELLRTITPHAIEVPQLPMSNLGNQTHAFFINSMLQVCAADNGRRKQPFIQGGNAVAVMRMAVHEITQLATQFPVHMVSNSDLISSIFIYVAKQLRIDFVPWSEDPTGLRGQPSTRILHNRFLSIGGHDAKHLDANATVLTPGEANTQIFRQSSMQIVHTNPAGEWSLLDVGLDKFHMMLHKTTLPIECATKYVGAMQETAIFTDTLNWSLSQFNPTSSVHKTVLFVALAITCLLPNVFTQFANKPNTSATIAQLEHYIRQLPCITLSRKGLTEKRPFILLVFSMFTLVYDTSAPILSNTEQKKKWFAKNSMKGITPFLLCCFRLARPTSLGALKAPRLGIDIKPYESDDIVSICDTAIGYIQANKEYGAFDALQYLAGSTIVEQLVKAGYLKSHPALPHASASSSKRTLDDLMPLSDHTSAATSYKHFKSS